MLGSFGLLEGMITDTSLRVHQTVLYMVEVELILIMQRLL